MGYMRPPMTDPQAELIQSTAASLYPNYRQPPLVMSRGEGVRLWDLAGREYLDLFAGIAVSTLGHAHPRLVSALAEQAGRVLHLSNYFYNEPNLRLAKRICQLTGMQRVLFGNSGTEAMEAMLKLARRYFYARGQEERFRIIAFENSFHGRTLGALAATGQSKYRNGFGPLMGVTHVPYGDTEAVRAAMGPDVAGILVEPVQGEGGVLPAPLGFLQGLREIADEHGALLLVDEIQTGVGRTGKFLAVEHAGVRPDALVLAKALGGGVPIGAMLCQGHLAEALPPGSHGSTFGGNPLASAAALTVLDVIEEQGLVAAATTLGEHLSRGLGTLVARYPQHLAAHRGLGLLQAVVLRPSLDPRELASRLREAGLLLTLAGGTALRFSPALVVSKDELDEGMAILNRVLEAL